MVVSQFFLRGGKGLYMRVSYPDKERYRDTMTKKLRRTWRSLELRTKLLVALVALLCSAAFAGTLAMEDAYIPWGESGHFGTNDDIIGSNFPSWFGIAFKTGSGIWDTNT